MKMRIALALIALTGLSALLLRRWPLTGEAHRLERELGLGEKPTEESTPGMPATQGGGLSAEIGIKHTGAP